MQGQRAGGRGWQSAPSRRPHSASACATTSRSLRPRAGRAATGRRPAEAGYRSTTVRSARSVTGLLPPVVEEPFVNVSSPTPLPDGGVCFRGRELGSQPGRRVGAGSVPSALGAEPLLDRGELGGRPVRVQRGHEVLCRRSRTGHRRTRVCVVAVVAPLIVGQPSAGPPSCCRPGRGRRRTPRRPAPGRPGGPSRRRRRAPGPH